MLEFIPPNDLRKLDRAIKALKTIIPKDSPKDKAIHQKALTELLKQKKNLLDKGDLD
ncbi:hypothetical protein [Clostridium kluyveri]|uniref:hypothetical protein n=1 Tax=Clostridium kluyveri TaxID=1534 RepID=UPI0018DC78E9|nr:hypothetical protein [Clostridium kluyveri]